MLVKPVAESPGEDVINPLEQVGADQKTHRIRAPHPLSRVFVHRFQEAEPAMPEMAVLDPHHQRLANQRRSFDHRRPGVAPVDGSEEKDEDRQAE